MVNREDLTRLIYENFPFEEFREHQEDAIIQVVQSYLQGKKFAVVESPTGSGKSVISYTAAKVIQELDPFPKIRVESDNKNPGPYSVATTKTRALQTQYRDTFTDMSLIWSATNYECAVYPYDPEASWGAWHCMKGKCEKFDQCAFFKAKQQFMMGQIGITNYAYFLNQSTLTPNIVIIDEAHNLEESLCNWMTVSLSRKFMPSFFDQLLAWGFFKEEDWDISKKTLSSLLELDPKQKNWMLNLRSFSEILQKNALKAHVQIETFFERCRENQTQIRTADGKKMTKFSQYFRNLARTLGLLVETKTEWVIADRECEKESPLSETQTIHFKPLYIEEVSQYFFNQAGFFILLSATVCGHKTMMKYLGVPKEQYHYIGVPSVIEVDQRPVYAFKNLGKLVWRNKEEMLPKFVNYLDSIIESQFEGVRGIVHTVSYENAEFIEAHSRNAHRMKFPKTEQLIEVLNLIQSAPDTIVVSPSVVEGLDLKDDLCRFSVFFKIPWASLGDEWVKRRKEDQKWYARNAAVQVVQGSGRGTRSKRDHSVTVILDASFLHIWYSHQDVLPDWFVEAVQIVKL